MCYVVTPIYGTCTHAPELWQVLYRRFLFLLVLQNMVQNPAIGPEMASTGAFDLPALQLYADDTERLLILLP
jgi:hypothetical protein